MASPYTPTVFVNGIESGSEEAILPVVTWDAGLSSFVDSTTDLPISGGGGGSGTVTSVSVTTANGVSGSVATATTTPAITLTLGAITPASVASVGTVTGSNLSGTNTGNQTSIVGITGTLAEFNTALTGADFATGGGTVTGVSSGTNTGDQTNITGNAATVTTNANLTGAITSTGNATSLGSFSSASLSGALTDETGSGAAVFGTSPTITTPNIVGTSTNDNAAAGSVGEYIESIVASGSSVSLTGAAAANITSLSLTAGDWDVEGAVGVICTNAATSLTAVLGSISTTSATLDVAALAKNIHTAIVPGNNTSADIISIARRRISIAAPTTIYLVGRGDFTVSTAGGFGRINARRVR